MVTSGHPLASQAGVRVMQAGGNAVDAAIATAAALNVVEPDMSGIGGDGFLMIWHAGSRELRCVNATGVAPKAAHRERYLTHGIPPKGMGSVSVPGLVDGWLLAHGEYGKLPLDQVFAPAVGLAEEGFPVSYRLAGALAAEVQADYADGGRRVGAQFREFPTSRAIFTRDGRPLRPGEILRQADLAGTFRLLAREGRAAFYEGELARKMARFSEELGGPLAYDDLAAHRAFWQEPIRTTYRGVEVAEFPPNSSGHVLLQELNIVERFDLAAMGWQSAAALHVMIEAKRLAFDDRERFMADPDRVQIPLAGMLSKEYAKERAARIDPGRAMTDLPPGEPQRFGDTTCFCVVDGEGNAVCQLQSLQSGFGSGLVAGDTGILLNNRMTYWHLQADHVNCLEPGKRVRHTMNPVMAFRDGALFFVCGTPGADTQVQTNLQLLTHVIDFGLNVTEAVEAPRWRHCGNGTESTYPHTCDDEVLLEARFAEETRAGLTSRGHAVRMLGAWEGAGNAQAIQVDASTGALFGASDPRRDGYAVGW
jgi:gamma-glutamyltranspeptidase/glutathione hydrolase